MHWSDLNTTHTDILEAIRDEWKSLMASNLAEESYHKFIAEHSAMCWEKSVYFSISKLQLAGKLVPDFVLIREEGSLGLQYVLVEIEKPSTQTVTGAHNPAAGLTHAIKQIRDWKNWIETNSQEAARLFPSKFSNDSLSHIKYLAVAGKRDGMSPEQELEKAKLSKELGYDIRSFDFITDNLNSYFARDYISPNSDIDPKHWERGLFHDFANPFYMSVSNVSWKKFINSSSLIRTHMIGKNIEALHALMTPNKQYKQFCSRYES